MATIFRVLGQVFPSANVETALYTCGTSSAIISSFIICNTANVADVISARLNVNNAPNDNKQLLYGAIALSPDGILELTAGITLATGDVLKVTSLNGTTAFQLFGQENN